MNMQDFFMKYGQQGVKELAARMDKKPSFFNSLIYGSRSGTKMPSLPTAIELVKKSGGLLTYEGLANPTALPFKKDRPVSSLLPDTIK